MVSNPHGYKMVPIDDVIPYPNNPRLNDDAVEAVANSIQAFGWQQPITVDKDMVVITGHTRLKAAYLLDQEEVPVQIADNLTDDEAAAYRLADNKVAEIAEWDSELLSEELANIQLDMSSFGFEELTPPPDEVYTTGTQTPLYEVKGEEPEPNQLYDRSKTDELLRELENLDAPADVKAFLVEAAHRHTVFNYANIAEFYAHQDERIQKLMEDSALVIIDVGAAIEGGYTTLTAGLEELLGEELRGS